jgi:hypothetical protein
VLARPGFLDFHAAKVRAGLAKPSDVERERRRRHGKTLTIGIQSKEGWKRSQRPEVRARVGAINSERALGWCPPERRDEYRHLVRSLRYSGAEARALIEADLRAKAPHEEPMSFQRKLEAVAAGARLVERRPIRRAGPEMTLGGIATGMLT